MAFHAALAMGPSNVHVVALAAGGLPLIGKAEEAAGYADRAIRLDPRMTAGNLNGCKDAYFMAQRYVDTVTTVTRMPEKSRSRDSWVFLTAGLARLGRTVEQEDVKGSS